MYLCKKDGETLYMVDKKPSPEVLEAMGCDAAVE
jgi:hypothetical protein